MVDAGTLTVQTYSLPSGDIAVEQATTLHYAYFGTRHLSIAGHVYGKRYIAGQRRQPLDLWRRGRQRQRHIQPGALIDVAGGTLVGSSCYNGQWAANQASLNVAAGAVFDGVEGNISIDALTGGGTLREVGGRSPTRSAWPAVPGLLRA